MKESLVYNKALNFSIRIVNLYKYLTETRKETVMSKQLLRCGTSIGANISEALSADDSADNASQFSYFTKGSQRNPILDNPIRKNRFYFRQRI